MKVSQGNFPCRYVKQTKMSFFSFIKLEKRRQNRSCLGGWYLGSGRSGERAWEGEYNANSVYTCMQMEK
jgi:hypothetical protein